MATPLMTKPGVAAIASAIAEADRCADHHIGERNLHWRSSTSLVRIEPDRLGRRQRAAAVDGTAAVSNEQTMEFVEVCGDAEARHRQLDAVPWTEAIPSTGNGTSTSRKIAICPQQRVDVGRRLPAIGTVQVVELVERDGALRIAGTDNARQFLDLAFEL